MTPRTRLKTWSDSPFEAVTPLAEVAARGVVIAEENGESQVLYESAEHPGWLVKLYRPGLATEPVQVLDRLIALPAEMPPADLALVDRSLCWPVSRVMDGERAAGVVLAKAPPEFRVEMRMISGASVHRLMDIDQLVQTDLDFYAKRGWATPTPQERLAVARNLAAVGVLLERYDIVYGDWSYANALWARGTGEIFLIDMDSCGLTDRLWVESKFWNDPAVPSGSRLSVHTDRYKLAVLVLRCLTGLRGPEPAAAHAALPADVRGGPLGEILWTAVTTGDPSRRPPMSELHALLASTPGFEPAQPAQPATAAAPSLDTRPPSVISVAASLGPAPYGSSSPSSLGRASVPENPHPSTGEPARARPSARPDQGRAGIDAEHAPAGSLLPLVIALFVAALALLAVAGLATSLFS
ncbi:hypothetical protein [Sphaerisporangium corydalis]|uniref:Protein kinase domain-containing protein n=1 Tax=Sphaerisporangium corydalis TaxID=1441875 RepID=A0ABV9ER11_9ACTN|nr:hypothetical protein [Sphaerisporangium corydalis]